MSMKLIVVGAGVAGLVCARTLLRSGIDVQVLEASDGVGGRVRSDHMDGFTLDRGFQVLFTAYPAAARQLDYRRLDLRRFDPGGVVCRAATRQILSDPVRDPTSAIPSVFSRAVPFVDKIRTALLSVELLAQPLDKVLDVPEVSTETYLRRRGFSDAFLDNFIRPFFGAVFLNDNLETSARAFRFDWRMLSQGNTVVPARGMGRISEQLAEELTATNRIRLNTRVTALVRRSEDAAAPVDGVQLENGETLAADMVVVATPAPEAARLTGCPMPVGNNGTTQFYFAGEVSLYSGRKILLHANRDAFVLTAIQVTNVAPDYAPAGCHLFSASVLGVPAGDDAALWARADADIRRMFAGDRKALSAWETFRPLRLYRIPYGQFAQPPGVYDTLPDNESGIPGLIFAGEFTAASSFNAAMASGEKAAALLTGAG